MNPQFADFNADGNLDLIIGGKTSDLFYFEGQSNGELKKRQQLMYSDGKKLSFFCGWTTPCDWDGDGKLDLILGGEAYPGPIDTTEWGIYFLKGNGDFTFERPVLMTADDK